MEIYIMRHPETIANVSGIIYGHLDQPLSDYGKEQVPLLRKEIEQLQADVIYASPLGRVAHWISDLPVVFDKRLAEMDFGVFEGLSQEEAEANYPEAYKQYFNDLSYVIPGGESYEGFRTRVHGFGDELLSTLDQRVLLITHSLVIKELMELFLDLPVGSGFALKVQPGSCIRILPVAPEARKHPKKKSQDVS